MIRFLVINEPHEIKLAASPKIALSTCCRGAGRAQSIPEKIKLFLCLFSVSCVIFQKEFSFLPCVLSRCSHVQLFLTLWSIAHQAPLAMGFSKQEYWSGLPFPSPMKSQHWMFPEGRDLLAVHGSGLPLPERSTCLEISAFWRPGPLGLFPWGSLTLRAPAFTVALAVDV